MRLWHIDIIPYLPNYQLFEQWKELDLIFRKQPKDILINYIYDYPKEYLLYYSRIMIKEFWKRHITIHNFKNYEKYFKDVVIKESDKLRKVYNDYQLKLEYTHNVSFEDTVDALEKIVNILERMNVSV